MDFYSAYAQGFARVAACTLPVTADQLHRECFCLAVDPADLRGRLEAVLSAHGAPAALAETHAHLFATLPVFIPASSVAAMARVVAAIEAVVATDAWAPAALAWAPEIARFDPQVVFLDIGLPDMSGYDVARRVRAAGAVSSPVLVALTGWGQEHDVRRALEAGCDHHVTKPASLARLRSILAAQAAPARA